MNNKKIKKYDYPEAIVGALIINNEEKILLGESVKWKGKWTVFGGHIELGEKAQDAVVREVKEETGLDVEVEAQLDFSESIFSKDFHEERHFVFLDYLCQYDSEQEIELNEEFKEDKYKWVTIEQALKIDLAIGTKQIIEKYLKYKEQVNGVDNWKRVQADFENFKKRQGELNIENLKFASRALIMEVIPVLDNFHASTDHIPEDQKDNGWVTGIMHIQKQLEKVLSDNGVEEITTKVGDKFNPEIHEAVENPVKSKDHGASKEAEEKSVRNASQGDAGGKIEEIIEKIVLKGYRLNDRVIRAARVIVE